MSILGVIMAKLRLILEDQLSETISSLRGLETAYSVTKKLGKEACPFNYLYWYFLNKNRALLEDSRRL
jgi:hypothetical protein